jgi:hypothetical protein
MALDSAGNPKIDFVWGNLPMQPDTERTGEGAVVMGEPNGDQNRGWSGYSVYPSNTLAETYSVELNNGIVQENLSADSHITAIDNWSSFPDFEPNTGFTAPAPSYYSAPSINHEIFGIRKQWQDSTLDYNMFFMFLQGQNHNLYNGNTVNISGSDVAEYNKNGWIVLDAVNDNTFNTGGTKVTIFWNGAISETANGTGGTYAKV